MFGYNGQLPQIMRGAGIDRFLTQKLSWNRFNPPAHHTFTWQGIDGSEVLAHFPPADTYNATAEVEELRRNARNYKDHDRSHRSLLVFGYGDGGGGPTPAMLETLRRAGDLQGVPRTTIATPEEFFDRARGRCRRSADHRRGALLRVPPRHLHQPGGGQARQPGGRAGAARRRVAVARWRSRLHGLEYPAERHRPELWQLLLLNQFHDILPGSSIALVYERAAADHAEVLAAAEAATHQALAALKGDGQGATPVNVLSSARSGVAEHPDGELVWVDAPAYGFGTVGTSPGEVKVSEAGGTIVLENALLRAEIGSDGRVRSLIELSTGREALAEPGNRLQLYEDRPTAFDAWDIDPFHLETVTRHARRPSRSRS